MVNPPADNPPSVYVGVGHNNGILMLHKSNPKNMA